MTKRIVMIVVKIYCIW